MFLLQRFITASVITVTFCLSIFFFIQKFNLLLCTNFSRKFLYIKLQLTPHYSRRLQLKKSTFKKGRDITLMAFGTLKVYWAYSNTKTLSNWEFNFLVVLAIAAASLISEILKIFYVRKMHNFAHCFASKGLSTKLLTHVQKFKPKIKNVFCN